MKIPLKNVTQVILQSHMKVASLSYISAEYECVAVLIELYTLSRWIDRMKTESHFRFAALALQFD